MTRAILERARLLRDEYERIGIVTFDYNPDYDDVLQDLRLARLWEKHMHHVNVYEFFMQRHDEERHDVKCINTDDHDVHHVFDRFGRLRYLKLFDRVTKKLARDYFFALGGSCFFERHFERETGKTLKCVAYHPNGEVAKTFNKVKDYRNFFIQSIIEKHDEVVLMSDSRLSDRVLFAVDHPKVAKVALLHSHHLQAPYQHDSRLVPRNGALIKRIQELDAFVTLTNRQAEEIQSRFGHRSTIHTVGHPIPTTQTYRNRSTYEPYTAVIVARY